MPSFLEISIASLVVSYFLAWLLELARLVVRNRWRGIGMIALVTAGLIAHTLYLGIRASHSSPPLSSSFDWYLLTAWMLVAAFLYLSYYFPRSPMGLFLLPLVLVLIGSATLWADRAPIASEPATRVWGAIHGVFLLLGTVAVTVGFVAGLMYLLQSYRLKHKLPPMQAFRMPSLEWLEKINSRLIHVSTIMVGGGFVSGIILKMVRERRFESIPWTDPVVWSSATMLAWLVAASIFNAFYKPARQGRKVAYLTVVSFVFLAFALMILMLVKTEHGRNPTEPRTVNNTVLHPAFFDLRPSASCGVPPSASSAPFRLAAGGAA